MPLIWQVDRLKRILAMSLMGGCSAHPEFDTRMRTSTGAPQRRHVVVVPSLSIRQYGQM